MRSREVLLVDNLSLYWSINRIWYILQNGRIHYSSFAVGSCTYLLEGTTLPALTTHYGRYVYQSSPIYLFRQVGWKEILLLRTLSRMNFNSNGFIRTLLTTVVVMPSNDIPRADVIIYSLRIATLKGGVYAAFIDLPINKHYNSITVSSILASLMQYPRNNNNIRGQRKDQHPRSRRLNDRFEDDK